MKILVFSQRDAENPEIIKAKVTEPYLWISIRCTWEKAYPKPIELEGLCCGTNFLKFDDLEHEEHARELRKKGYDAAALFAYNQAQSIYHFVNNWIDELDLICIHCGAGASRSPAIAKALSLWLNGNDGGFHHENGYFPNGHTFSLMSSVIREFLEMKKQNAV